MNSRERVLAAINREPVDRIPTDIWATSEAWAKLRERFGEDADIMSEFHIDGMRIMFKDIEGYPEPWKVEEVKVNITNNLANTADYKLIYRLSDYWGKKIKSVEHNIPQNADSITLKPFTDKKIGWWKMDASIVYKDDTESHKGKVYREKRYWEGQLLLRLQKREGYTYLPVERERKRKRKKRGYSCSCEKRSRDNQSYGRDNQN